MSFFPPSLSLLLVWAAVFVISILHHVSVAHTVSPPISHVNIESIIIKELLKRYNLEK